MRGMLDRAMRVLEALKGGDKRKALALLKAGGDANELGNDGVTPLMWAADQGDLALVRALLAAGADPSLEDRIGETALVKASAGGHQPVFDLLAPLASEEEREAARAYLRASGKEQGPAEEDAPSFVRTKLAETAANVANLLGDEQSAQRMERVKRAKKNRKD